MDTKFMSIGSRKIGIQFKPFVIADDDCEISFSVLNNSGSALSVFISVVFEEISARSAAFGLTASTLLQPDTEMAIYG